MLKNERYRVSNAFYGRHSSSSQVKILFYCNFICRSCQTCLCCLAVAMPGKIRSSQNIFFKNSFSEHFMMLLVTGLRIEKICLVYLHLIVNSILCSSISRCGKATYIVLCAIISFCWIIRALYRVNTPPSRPRSQHHQQQNQNVKLL